MLVTVVPRELSLLEILSTILGTREVPARPTLLLDHVGKVLGEAAGL